MRFKLWVRPVIFATPALKHINLSLPSKVSSSHSTTKPCLSIYSSVITELQNVLLSCIMRRCAVPFSNTNAHFRAVKIKKVCCWFFFFFFCKLKSCRIMALLIQWAALRELFHSLSRFALLSEKVNNTRLENETKWKEGAFSHLF